MLYDALCCIYAIKAVQVHGLSYCQGLLAAAGGLDLTDGLLDYSAKENRGMKALVWKSTEMAGLWDQVADLDCKAVSRDVHGLEVDFK